MPSRRTFLATLGTAGVSGVAGCSGLTGESSPEPDDPPAADPDAESKLNPRKHVYGATGSWSSPGCNAANTREVADGQAPVAEPEVRWRTDASEFSGTEPLVANDQLYLSSDEGLRALDAATGEERWSFSGTNGESPLVRGSQVYVPTYEGLTALDSETGDVRWRTALDGNTKTPGYSGSGWLAVPSGETLHRIEPDRGEVQWSRRLFGELLGSPALWSISFPVVASEAGVVYLLDGEGTGYATWDVPSKPQAPPTTDTDYIYVGCFDAKTYALGDLGGPEMATQWSTQTGFVDIGIGVSQGLVCTASTDLTAIDGESGEVRWTFEKGDWRHTAPAFGRDTLFVGGDRLWALDPTPGGEAGSDGPAVRWEKEFHGRVGPGPVLDDGRLFTVAQTDEEEFELLALW